MKQVSAETEHTSSVDFPGIKEQEGRKIRSRQRDKSLQSPEQESEEGQTRYESLTVDAEEEGEGTNTNCFPVTQGFLVGWELKSYRAHPVITNNSLASGKG